MDSIPSIWAHNLAPETFSNPQSEPDFPSFGPLFSFARRGGHEWETSFWRNHKHTGTTKRSWPPVLDNDPLALRRSEHQKNKIKETLFKWTSSKRVDLQSWITQVYIKNHMLILLNMIVETIFPQSIQLYNLSPYRDCEKSSPSTSSSFLIWLSGLLDTLQVIPSNIWWPWLWKTWNRNANKP